MQFTGTNLLEISMITAAPVGLSRWLAPSLERNPEIRKFSVRPARVLLHLLGCLAGIGAVALAGWKLLLLGAGNWLGWTSFASGFALVLLTLSIWPEPLVFDREGVFERSCPASRIRWADLSHFREYRVRGNHGIVLHSIYGKQLVLPAGTYDLHRVVDALLELHPVPFQSAMDTLAPVPILKAHPR